ncbi:MAG: LysM domain-containing protein [Thermomicrobiales bacterium]
MFPITSRYAGLETVTLAVSADRTITYLRRRFVPASDRFVTIQEHVVVQGDRLDNIAAHYLNDPEQFWRLCDANGALRPDELTDTLGRRLRITLPEGLPGIANGQ